ncbi:uncharacterized protein N7459_006258 [Penicillium hispanicum]|uniref:uncharacterized protein n=1 Tax=Penicillium hispanicum TaxID=1080232 RepID=UPI00254194CA|nr:uncharacterized protein N7459_006258 [Penicillium hispanicum]KAJ5580273.1 hypothetical protein N7459_006258 [Penicillium hispanicum]
MKESLESPRAIAIARGASPDSPRPPARHISNRQLEYSASLHTPHPTANVTSVSFDFGFCRRVLGEHWLDPRITASASCALVLGDLVLPPRSTGLDGSRNTRHPWVQRNLSRCANARKAPLLLLLNGSPPGHDGTGEAPPVDPGVADPIVVATTGYFWRLDFGGWTVYIIKHRHTATWEEVLSSYPRHTSLSEAVRRGGKTRKKVDDS